MKSRQCDGGLLAAGRWLALVLSLLALAVLGAWLVGRIANDRWLWSQYLWWAPTPAVFAGAGVLVALAWLGAPPATLLGRSFTRASRSGPARRGGDGAAWRRLRLAATVGLLVAGAWHAVAELRLHRAVLGPAEREGLPLRVVFWNASGAELTYPPTLLSRHQPDLVVVGGPRWKMGRDMLFKAVSEHRLGPEHVLWRGQFAVASRYPILESGYTTLGLGGERSGMVIERHGSAAIDHGEALYMELDARDDLGRTLVVWVLDLPSDPSLSRRDMVDRARLVIDTWPGGGGEGFPEPEIAMGDLNTPRGSWSLSRLLPQMRHAAADAGWGPLGSFPRERPLWHIDHVFVRRPIGAVEYRLVDPGEGRHLMQVAELRLPPSGG